MADNQFDVRARNRSKAASFADLQTGLAGRIITPQDQDYEAARTIFYGGFDRRPALFVRAANPADVARAILFAREQGLELAVRSGGHSVAGHSLSDGGLVIDLRELRGLEVDAAQRTAWAETGLTAGEYTMQAAEHGLATGFGDTGSVGIGGITLGGGVGFLVRKHGLTIDHLLAAEIVTADGQIRRIDVEHDPDLFWAIRGGGGNFGVVTRFQFQLHELTRVVGGMLFLPATAQIIADFMDAAQAAPEELSAIANVMPAPPMPFIPPEVQGQMIVMALMLYAGDPQAGEAVMAPFRRIAKPLADMVRPMTYPEMFPPEANSDYHPTAVSHNKFMRHIDLDAAKTIMELLQASDASVRVAQLRPLGGAMARVPVDATAYYHRLAPIMVNLAAFYATPEEKVRRETWVADFARALDQGEQGAYVNFIADEGAERIRAAYPGPTWERLSAIKARYDPTNLFHVNHNIPPASVM